MMRTLLHCSRSTVIRSMCALFAACLCGYSAHSQQYMFQINDFKAFNETINLRGASGIAGDKLRLTSDKPNLMGACWYSEKQIDFKDGFETEFTFLITKDKDGSLPGDGFAFVIQAQSPDITGGTGDDIGYKQIPYAVALEFDTKDDHEGSRNHVNLSYYNPESKTYRRYATVHAISEITDGNAHFTRIIYQDGRLQVYLDSYLFPILSVKLDIAEKIKSPDNKAWLGFTASTSDLHSNHDLIAWSVRELEGQPENIYTESIEVLGKGTIQVKQRRIIISVWDPNVIDGDIISLKLGPEWILTEYQLTGAKYSFPVTILGFNQELILFAHNIGMVPPNTASISVYDGVTTQHIVLDSDMQTSESIKIAFTGNEEK